MPELTIPDEYNEFNIYAGTTWSPSIQWQVNGSAVDMSNDIQSARMIVRDPLIATPIFDGTSAAASGIRVETDLANGFLYPVVPAADSDAVNVTTLNFRLNGQTWLRYALNFELQAITNAGHTWSAGFQSLFSVSGTTAEEWVTTLIRGTITFEAGSI